MALPSYISLSQTPSSLPLIAIHLSLLPPDPTLPPILHELTLSDYVLVLFCANANIQWKTWRKVYNELTRQYKKNIKQCYLVHPSSVLKFTINKILRLLSKKAEAKLHTISTLSELQSFLPLRDIKLTQDVINHNKQIEPDFQVHGLKSQPAIAGQVFRVPLKQLMGEEGEFGIPVMLSLCMEHIRREGINTEGIFRRSPASTELAEVKQKFDQGSIVDLNDYSIHTTASLIKVFLADLPEPIIPSDIYASIEDADLIKRFDPPTFLLVKELTKFLKEVIGSSDMNKMTAANMSIVFGPNLVRGSGDLGDMRMAGLAGVALRKIVDRWDEYFDPPQFSIGSVEDLSTPSKRSGRVLDKEGHDQIDSTNDSLDDLTRVFTAIPTNTSSHGRGGAAI